MPELPEVETTRRGIAPALVGATVATVRVRDPRLRWPVPVDLSRRLAGNTIEAVDRRAKYLLLRTPRGTLIVHLGMSGSLRLLPAAQPPGRHDHVDLVLGSGQCLRLNDPRRFGAVLWTEAPPQAHPLLRDLGPEPLDADFDGTALYADSRHRRTAVKSFIMDSHVVVGVGNIYASEALFLAGIHPRRSAGRIAAVRYARLAAAIREVLEAAITAGGTTLRDFVGGDGRPGYFGQQLRVYGRAGLPCERCGTRLRRTVQVGRATYYCPRCQH